jgi:hypothetical protein
LGSAILPAFNSFVGWIADMGRDVIAFTQLYPELTKWLGYTAIAFTVAIMAGGAFTVMMGASKMAMVAWGVAAMAWAGITATLSSGLVALRTTMFALNMVLGATPLGWIILAIGGAVAAVTALIYYWDDLVKMFDDWGWLKAITGIFATVWAGVKAIFNDTMNWIIDKLNMIPGVDIDANISSAAIPSIAAIAPVQTRVDKGGITQSLSTANQQKSTNVGTVNVYPAKGENVNIPAYLEMHA